MRISAEGLRLIKSFEGFRETATRLPDGRWTIGYGHVRTAREGLTISEKDAEDLLLHDLKPVEDAIAPMFYAPLMQNQFDALVSLAFNISSAQFRDSDVLRNLNAGDYLAAANAFDLWRRARINGRIMVVDALVRRRAAEKALFLEHPSGPPSAPTPAVRPEIDLGEHSGRTVAETLGQPRPRHLEDDDTYGGPSPSGDIAEAVRRLAERTMEAISPAPEIPLPPGATVAPPENAAARTGAEPSMEAGQKEPNDARRAAAERVARILERAEQEISGRQTAAPAVPDGRPPAGRGTMSPSRRVIDDTETFDPGRDPADMFAEGERKARIVNGHARRLGPISGRWVTLAPWIVVLVLSVLGLIIGAVDTFKADMADGNAPRAAATLLAVFGVMLLMSVYFIFWNRPSDEA
jgi:lysozyme